MTPAEQLAALQEQQEHERVRERLRERRRARAVAPADHAPIAEEVHVDQVTALYLALRARSYEEIAAFVRMQPDAVRERVHAMLVQIGGTPPVCVAPEDQGRLMDYVLQQLPSDDAEHHQAIAVLRRSAPARAWADQLIGELRALAPPEMFFPEVRKPPREHSPARATRRPKGATPLPPSAPPPAPVEHARRVITVLGQLAIVALVVIAYWLVVTHGQVLGGL